MHSAGVRVAEVEDLPATENMKHTLISQINGGSDPAF